MFGKHKRYSVFVLLPRTENSFTCKTENDTPIASRGYVSLTCKTKNSAMTKSRVGVLTTEHIKSRIGA